RRMPISSTLGLGVDDAVIETEGLKKQRAELVLAELTDAEAIAAENAAVEAAQRDMEAAEAVANAWPPGHQRPPKSAGRGGSPPGGGGAPPRSRGSAPRNRCGRKSKPSATNWRRS